VVRTLGQEPLGACDKQCGEARGELTAHRRGDALGLAWLVLVVGAYLSPSLKDGFSFGPADIGRQLSYLTYVPHLAVHNSVNGDIITQEVPWNTLDWLAVHHGQLPLWNNYSGDGMPLMLNFESKSLALPTLVGYLFPLSVSFLASIAALLLIAGSGAYVAARLIGAGPLGAALAGTTFMLSGSLSGWAGWAVSGPLVWAGWVLAGAVLCWKPGRWRSAGVVVVALSTAFAVYGGFPETFALGALGTGSIVVIAGACGAAKGKVRVAGPARLTAGVAAGAALSSPLWLSGLSVLSQSSRAGENGTGGLPVRALSLLFAQGYDGLPTKGSVWFGPLDYYEATAYVGTVALVLAVLAVLVGWHRPVVAGLVGTVLISLGVVYAPTAQHLFTDLGAGSVATQRMLPMLAFALAMLAGLGAEALRRSWRDTTVRIKLAVSTGACALVLAYLLIDARSGGVTAAELSVRRHALIWPALTLAGTAAGLAAATFSLRRTNLAAGKPAKARTNADGRAVRATFVVLLAAQSAYLVWAGIGLNTYSSNAFPVTGAVAELQRLVGNKLFALDGPNGGDVTRWTGDGIYPEVNIGYQIRELAVHDPVTPPAYFKTWPDAAATANYGLGNNIFAPSVTSAALARFYGASYVLATYGRVPKGTKLVATIAVPIGGTLKLYSVPGAAQFSFPAGSSARVVSAHQTGNATWRLAVEVPTRSTMTLRLTYVPGWHVEADGRALAVHKLDGLFVGAVIPPGTRTLVVNYWPSDLTAGFALALAVIALLGVVAAAELTRLRRTGQGATVTSETGGTSETGVISETGAASGTESTRSILSLTTSEEPPGGMLTP
jgi:hypothetical protein